MFFKNAVKRGVVSQNPFVDVKAPEGDASHRFHFVSCKDVEQAIAAAPDYTWRLIIALSRYGGFRCPSEVFKLRWDCVDWDKQRIKVLSPKTEHHPNRGSRIIPLFAELRSYMEEAWDMAEEGAVYVIDKHRNGVDTSEGWRNTNIRTQFTRILSKAGIKPCPEWHC